MNCIKEAENKLRMYKGKTQALKSLQDQIEYLESEMTTVRSASADGTAVHGGGSGRETALLDNIAERAELGKALEQTRTWVDAVSGALRSLTSDERRVLDLFYIEKQKGHVERLSEEFNVEKAQVYRRKEAALLNFVHAFYGVTET